MAQYGVGPEFSAQCPRAPTLDGWRPWTESDGPIPDAIVARGKALIADDRFQLGSAESFPLPGVIALLRVEPHVWGRTENGDLVQGCFRATGVYLPEPQESTPQTAGSTQTLGRTIAVLTAASLAIGIATTLIRWRRK